MSAKGKDFIRLSPIVRRHTPPSSPNNDFPLLIICLWMGASPKHIEKYKSEYLFLFPHTQILLIESTISTMFVNSYSTLSTLLQPALDTILSLSQEQRARLRFVIYSNGGTHSANALAKIYRKKTGQLLNVVGMVLDSAPGNADLSAGHGALSVSFPKTPPLSYLFNGLLWIILYIWLIVVSVTGILDPITKIGNDLNDTTLWNVGGGSKRVYIFSDSDLIVPRVAVQQRSQEAMGKGWEVKEEQFVGSRHVAHALIDRERYWKIVKEALDFKA